MSASESVNPLLHAASATWDRLIAGVNPPSMLVAIGGLMGHALRHRYEPEDVWQETLLQAWSSRQLLEWRGPAAFRQWLLGIARNRVLDLADRTSAQKRGAGREQRFADRDVVSGSHNAEHYAGPCARTTPCRAAADREAAAMFEQALTAVPDESRDIVRLRLFEDATFEEIATRLDLGVEGVRYRFRQGADAYGRALRRQRIVAPTAASSDSAQEHNARAPETL